MLIEVPDVQPRYAYGTGPSATAEVAAGLARTVEPAAVEVRDDVGGEHVRLVPDPARWLA